MRLACCGCANKATVEIKSFAAKIIDDPKYAESAKKRIIEGKAPHLELALLAYRYGKPKDAPPAAQIQLRAAGRCVCRWCYCVDYTEPSATTGCRCVPMPSIVHMAVSPARIQRGSARSMFVPAGLPPAITSPGFSVRRCDP